MIDENDWSQAMENKPIKILYQGGSGEIVEKK